MKRTHHNSGFSLVEVMIASAIGAVILIAAATSFIFCQRMFRQIMTETEIAMVERDIREKLLFHAGPGLDSGLLTGKATADSASINMNWATVAGDNDNFSPSKIRIIWRTNSKGGRFFNERLPHDQRNINWFLPGSFLMQHDWSYAVNLPVVRIDVKSDVVEDVSSSSFILLPQ